MRDLRLLRAFGALVAGLSCLAAPLLVSGAWPTEGHHGEATFADVVVQPAESGHDSCWIAEVDAHKRHDDRRFEPQRGLRHHLHAAVAWSGAVSVEPPGPALHADLPCLDAASLGDSSSACRTTDRSPRQSRAPPRA